MTASMHLSDRDWRNLLREIHSGNVIPVVGPGLVTVPDAAGNQVVLYKHLAPQLARDLDLDEPDSYTTFNSVARDFLLGGGERKDLYIGIGCILDQLDVPPPKALVELAGITDFELFISGTIDPLLARAVAKARPGFSPERGVIRFHPAGNPNRSHQAPLSGNAEAPCDLPATFRGPLVYHILGDFNTVPDFAVWEEDYMEFIFGLIESRDLLENLFRMLGSRDLLLLGAPSDDWIVRFFLRVARGKRLSDLPRRGYLADSRESLGDSMVFFIDKAVKATRIIEGSPSEFVSQLATRWHEAYGTSNESDADSFLQRQPDDMPRGSVFVSYSHDDLAATVRVAQALAAAGVPVWLDRQRLKFGENYDRSLEHAIKFDSSFFLSIISRASESDPTRYVHKERAWAAQKHVDGFVFYLPLVIDEITDVRLEPRCFANVDREHLLKDRLPGFVTRVRQLVEQFRDSGHPRG
ncbi:MAG: hypothetical protein JWM11_7263 [Planctomycetaceae bacterium]|nr:hypothetical protein [Planctomycetaceae bacterium]